MADLIPLSRIAPLLRERYDGHVFSYVRLWQLATTGALPGVSDVCRRWVVDLSKLDELAHALGMTPRVPVVETKRRRAKAMA